MCGIAGYCGDFDSSLLNEMNMIQAHRGPDGHGIWFESENHIGLAHSRLAIIDISSAGYQPMVDTSGRAVITYNGEIYNYKELRHGLESEGYQFESDSDTEVLLKMYHRYGSDLLAYLNGIFAFAVWDQEKKELFLARDGVGVKPLYYSAVNDSFLFASEIKALMVSQQIARRLNYHAIASHLTYLWSPHPNTVIDGVFKLEPGQAMIVRRGVIARKWVFYDLPYQTELRIISEEEAALETRRLVSQAVQRQMMSDVPVGAFLSGGLDSSAVVAFAREHSPRHRIQTFSIDLQGQGLAGEGLVNDLPYALKVAEHLDVDLKVVKVGAEIIQNLERMLYHLDEPQADPAPLNALFISRLAAEQGVKVLLSGAGGDDIFTGYRRHYALAQERYWSWLPLFLRKGLSGVSSLFPSNSPTGRRVVKAFKYADFDRDKRIASYFFWLNRDFVFDVLSKKSRESLGGYDPALPLLQTLAAKPKSLHPLNKMLYLEGKHFLADHNLNYTDKAGMAEGVEIRVPLLDPDLIAFAASLPLSYKQKGRSGKYIFKKAMKGILPEEVIHRPKTGFAAPLRYWLQNELKEMVDDVLSPGSIRQRGIFDYEGISRLRKMDANGKVDAAYPIFSMVCMELWCRIFIDRPVPGY